MKNPRNHLVQVISSCVDAWTSGFIPPLAMYLFFVSLGVLGDVFGSLFDSNEFWWKTYLLFVHHTAYELPMYNFCSLFSTPEISGSEFCPLITRWPRPTVNMSCSGHIISSTILARSKDCIHSVQASAPDILRLTPGLYKWCPIG